MWYRPLKRWRSFINTWDFVMLQYANKAQIYDAFCGFCIKFSRQDDGYYLIFFIYHKRNWFFERPNYHFLTYWRINIRRYIGRAFVVRVIKIDNALMNFYFFEWKLKIVHGVRSELGTFHFVFDAKCNMPEWWRKSCCSVIYYKFCS
jgi:hypothetical protein